MDLGPLLGSGGGAQVQSRGEEDPGAGGRQVTSEHKGDLDRFCEMAQGMELPLVEGQWAELPMQQPEEVGMECWAQRGQAGLGRCTTMGSLGCWLWLGATGRQTVGSLMPVRAPSLS